MKKLIYISFVSAIFSCLSFSLQAAPAPPPGGGTPPCWPGPCVPIDGNIGLMLVFGLGVGAKALFAKSKD